MEREYPWETASTYSPPRREGLGWYVLVAVILALIIHVVALVRAGNTFYESEVSEATGWVSQPVRLNMAETEIEEIAEIPPEEELERPIDDSELADDPEAAIAELRDIDIDINTEVEEVSFPEMRIEKPILAGTRIGDLLKPTVGDQKDSDIPDPGKISIDFQEAKRGQIIVDEGTQLADILDPDKVVQDLGKLQGGNGSDTAGEIIGYTGLSAYANMSPGELQQNKATIGSDLLFEFNRDTLKDDARITLLTVAQLIDRNPGMFCWVEGHTDTFGGEEFNFQLSLKRGQAVKDWLVRSLQLEPKFIVIRALGKTEPVVEGGDRNTQAANRRVDIKMRKIPPNNTAESVLVKPGKPPEEIPRGIPVEDDEGVSIPRAILVPDDELSPKVMPVGE